MTTAADDFWLQHMQIKWAEADRMGAIKVQDIPLPWTHQWGTVVSIEYPKDRPMAVDLVFEDGMRTAETKDSRYIEYPNGIWNYPGREHG